MSYAPIFTGYPGWDVRFSGPYPGNGMGKGFVPSGDGFNGKFGVNGIYGGGLGYIDNSPRKPQTPDELP